MQYITEKNDSGRSFFSKIKTGVTGVLYNTYEPDYMEITANGSKDIPEDNIETDISYITELHMKYDKDSEEFRNKANVDFERISMNSLDEAIILNTKALYKKEPRIKKEDIQKIYKEHDIDIEIKSMDVKRSMNNNNGGIVLHTVPIGKENEVVNCLKEKLGLSEGDAMEAIEDIPIEIYSKYKLDDKKMMDIGMVFAGIGAEYKFILPGKN